MDELNQKLAGILNDPESMNRIKEMAESILSQNDTPKEDESVFGNIDSAELSSIMSIVSKLNQNNRDTRTDLLSALKPHLSEPKREKVDTAIKILRLLDLLPLLKESGILGKLI